MLDVQHYPLFLYPFHLHVWRSKDNLQVCCLLLSGIGPGSPCLAAGAFTCGANLPALSLLSRSQANPPCKDCALLLWSELSLGRMLVSQGYEIQRD